MRLMCYCLCFPSKQITDQNEKIQERVRFILRDHVFISDVILKKALESRFSGVGNNIAPHIEYLTLAYQNLEKKIEIGHQK